MPLTDVIPSGTSGLPHPGDPVHRELAHVVGAVVEGREPAAIAPGGEMRD